MNDIDSLRLAKDRADVQVKMLEELVSSKGWELLRQILENQMLTRKGDLIGTPIHSLDASFRAAYSQGELSGIGLALRLPDTLIDNLKVDIEQYKNTINKGEES